MIVLSKKRILTVAGLMLLAVLGFMIKTSNKENTVQTVALPVSNKVIVIDAGHGKPDEGAQSSSRNNGSTNKFKNCIKSSKLIRTSWSNSYFNKK